VAIDWLQRGIANAPHQGFGYTRLGWLLWKTDPQLAAKAFARSAQLIPAQRGVFYGLGRTLLANGKTELAIEAFALEILRDPSFLARPLWSQPDLQPVLGGLSDRLEEKYAILLKDHPQPGQFKTDLHQNRGGLRWWLGNYKGAREDWQDEGGAVSKLVLQLASLESREAVETELRMLPSSAAKWAIEAWLYPEHRLKRLQQAWTIASPETVSPEIVQKSLATMNAAPSFDEWLKQNAPLTEKPLADQEWTPWGRDFQRLAIEDFPQLLDNTIITHFFGDELWRSPAYSPELDRALQPWRESLLNAALSRE
jgi:tetratricopeptide (TPR) repeat protein